MTRASLLLSLALLALTACERPGDAATRNERTVPADTATTRSAEAISLHDLDGAWRDQRDVRVRLQEIGGTVRVVALVYTNCQATCPLIVASLKRVEASLPADRRSSVRFVLVSLDPARDTPGRLAEWAQATRLDPARWTLLNGSDGQLRELAAVLGIRYQRQPDGEMAHTNAVTVVDRAGVAVHQQESLSDSESTVEAVQALLR